MFGIVTRGNKRVMEEIVARHRVSVIRVGGVGSSGRTKRVLRNGLFFLIVVFAMSGCGSPYGDLQVGDCVSGFPQMEDLFDEIDCKDAADSGEVYYKVVNKAPDSDAVFDCSPFSHWISDGEWQICFEPMG